MLVGEPPKLVSKILGDFANIDTAIEDVVKKFQEFVRSILDHFLHGVERHPPCIGRRGQFSILFAVIAEYRLVELDAVLEGNILLSLEVVPQIFAVVISYVPNPSRGFGFVRIVAVRDADDVENAIRDHIFQIVEITNRLGEVLPIRRDAADNYTKVNLGDLFVSTFFGTGRCFWLTVVGMSHTLLSLSESKNCLRSPKRVLNS